MSFDTGSAAPYIPPPPRRALSPWAWAGIGCGFVTLLAFGGCAVLTSMVAREMKKPVNKAEILTGLAPIPIYPGATFDQQATSASSAIVRMTRGITGGKLRAIGAFRSDDEGQKILDWYEQKLPALGYSAWVSGNTEMAGARSARQAKYVKGADIAVIQAQAQPGSEGKGTVLVLMHAVGLDKKK